jgi:hypothetical protein
MFMLLLLYFIMLSCRWSFVLENQVSEEVKEQSDAPGGLGRVKQETLHQLSLIMPFSFFV